MSPEVRSPFEAHTCSAPAERSERMRDIVVRHAVLDRPIALLDVGCGTGSLVFRLADALPLAAVAGIDLSMENVREAEAQRGTWPSAARVRFSAVDYFDYRTDPVDVIATEGALHFIRGGSRKLWPKLARDLKSGGLIVTCMAYDCLHNRLLRSARRVARRIRSRPLDLLIFVVARLVHGGRMDKERLRERVEYMYIPPEQLMTRCVATELAPSLGLRVVAEYDMPSTSATELKQRTTVFVKK